MAELKVPQKKLEKTSDYLPANTGYHPGFVGGMEILLWKYKNQVNVDPEKWINTGGLRIDMLILKKDPGLEIEHEIARIFKGHNIIEYKRPDDDLNIDVFSKVMSYAYLYKSQSVTLDGIPFTDMSATIYRHRYPRSLFRSLKENGMMVEKAYEGVYYVTGFSPFPVQIIVGKELSSDRYSMLKVLAPNASREDIKNFNEIAKMTKESAYQRFVDDIYQASVSVNRELYAEMIKEDPTMCEALRDLFKEDFIQAERRGVDETRLESIKNIMEGLKYSAQQAMDLLKIPAAERGKYIEKL